MAGLNYTYYSSTYHAHLSIDAILSEDKRGILRDYASIAEDSSLNPKLCHFRVSMIEQDVVGGHPQSASDVGYKVTGLVITDVERAVISGELRTHLNMLEMTLSNARKAYADARMALYNVHPHDDPSACSGAKRDSHGYIHVRAAETRGILDLMTSETETQRGVLRAVQSFNIRI